MQRNSARFFDGGDAAAIVGLPVLSTVAWALPPAAWPSFIALAAPFQRAGWGPRPFRRIAAALGDNGTASPTRILNDLAANDIEAMLWLLRTARPRGWKLRAHLRGAQHLDAALAAGSGAVLWVGHFTFASLLSKVTLHANGYDVHHLSHPRHGFSDTRFGIRFLNPIRQRLERQFLASREELSPENPAVALRNLRRRLADNRTVSFTARSESAKPATVPFLSGGLTLATGAADLAYASGAPLFPVMTLRGGDGAFVTEIQPPLPLDRAASRSVATQAATAAFARRLEPVVLSAPGQWLGWLHPSLRPAPTVAARGPEAVGPRRSASRQAPAG